MIQVIRPGDRVAFDDAEHGPQKGRLIGFTNDLSNGAHTAVVEVDHAMPGMVWAVEAHKIEPLTEQLAAA